MVELISTLTSNDSVETMRSVQETLNFTSAFLKDFGSLVAEQVNTDNLFFLYISNIHS